MSPIAAFRVSSSLAFIAASGFLLASIVSTFVGASIEPEPTMTPVSSTTASPGRVTIDPKKLSQMFGFKPRSSGIIEEAVPSTPLPPLSLQVLATMVANDARYSMALIFLVANRKTVIASIGTEFGPQEIARIERDPPRIVLRDKVTGTESTVMSAAPPSTTMTAVSPLVSDLGIQQTSPGEVTVPRTTMDAQLGDVMKLATTVHVMPAAKGITLDRILPGSPLTQLGLMPGDTLTNINGIDLRSPEQWMEAVTRLRSSSDFQVSIERGGAPVQLRVRIR